jgi:hypothetical protein
MIVIPRYYYSQGGRLLKFGYLMADGPGRAISSKGAHMRIAISGFWILALLLVLPGMASAQSSSSSVVVQSVTFALDDGAGAAGVPVTSFNTTDHTLHAVAQLDQVLVNPNFHVAWMAVAIDSGTNIPIADAAVTRGGC